MKRDIIIIQDHYNVNVSESSSLNIIRARFSYNFIYIYTFFIAQNYFDMLRLETSSRILDTPDSNSNIVKVVYEST